MDSRGRKKLVATATAMMGVGDLMKIRHNRTSEPDVTFCFHVEKGVDILDACLY